MKPPRLPSVSPPTTLQVMIQPIIAIIPTADTTAPLSIPSQPTITTTATANT